MYIAISTIIFFIIIISAILFYISIKSFYKKNTNSIPVEYLQSMNYLLSEQHDKALDTFMSMVSVNQDTAETHIILGNLFRNRGEVDRAIRIHQNLIARPELKPEIRQECTLELAKDYLKAGFLDRAELIFVRLANDINYPLQILQYLKEIYEQEKEWEKAIEISVKIQSIDGEDISDVISHYYCELVELELSLFNDDSIEKAKKYVNKAISYNNNSLRALILIGNISYESKNYADALKKYMIVHDKYPEQAYLVIDNLKKTYEKLNLDDNFFSFIKNFSKRSNPMELYSNLHDEIGLDMSNSEISELYENEFREGNPSLPILSEYLDLISKNRIAFDNISLRNIKKCVDIYSSKENTHQCQNCGFNSVTHYWQCPSCQEWSSIKKNILNKLESSTYVIPK